MRTRIRRSAPLLALALAPLLPTVAVAQQGFPATEDLEVMLRYLVEDQETPGVVLLGNAAELGDDLVFDLLRAPPPAVVAGNAAMDRPLAVEEMGRYVGTYAVQMGPRTRELKVFVQGDRLMLQPPGTGATVLLYQSDHEFLAEENIGMRFAFTMEDGHAERLTVHVNGRAMSGPRTQ